MSTTNWIAKLYYMIHITRTRMRSKLLMAQRAAEIKAGLVHHTPAMAESVAKLGG